MTLFLLGADLLYFIEPRTPRDLGDATALVDSPATHNAHVRLKGIADLASSLRVGRQDGDARVVKLGGGPVLVVTPAVGLPGTPPDGTAGLASSGLFDGAGRLYAAASVPKAWVPVVRRMLDQGEVRYVLMAGESPGSAWFGAVASLVVALLGGLALVLGVRAWMRMKRQDAQMAHTPQDRQEP